MKTKTVLVGLVSALLSFSAYASGITSTPQEDDVATRGSFLAAGTYSGDMTIFTLTEPTVTKVTLNLVESDAGVTGDYRYSTDTASFDGTLSDIKLEGLELTAKWAETFNGQEYTGLVKLSFQDETYASFKGTWGYNESDSDGGEWSGAKQ